MTKEIAELIKENCAGVFFDARRSENDPNFGVDSWEDASRIIRFSAPDENYYPWQRPFLPKPFRNWVAADNVKILADNREGLNVFHYPLNKRKVARTLVSFAETDQLVAKYQAERMGVPIGELPNYDHLLQRFGDASCILINIWGYFLLVGPKDINQQVMDYLKSASENTFAVSKELLVGRESLVDSYRQRWANKTANFYDFLGKPREVHFQLN